MSAASSRDQVATTATTVEAKGVERIDQAERHGKPRSQFTLWFAANVQFATLVTGALATAIFGLSFWTATAAIVVGTVIGSALLAALASAGPRLGVSQLVQSRGPFGHFGNFLPAALTFLGGCGWFAVSTVLGVFALQAIVPVRFTIGLIVLAIAQVLIAIVGYRLIHAIERILSIVLTVLFLVVTVFAVWNLDTGPRPTGAATGPLGVAGAVILVVAITSARTLGYSCYASDYSRYLPARTSSRSVLGYGFAGAAIGGVWLGVVGAALGTLRFIGTPADLVTNLLPSGLAVLTMIALILSTAASSCIDIYSASLAALVVGIPLRRWVAALVVGTIGSFAAWFAGQDDYYASFQSFLILIGYWIAPWSAIMVVQVVRVVRKQLPDDRFYDRTWRFGPGLWAFFAGVIASVPFMNQPGLLVGPIAARNPQWGDITNLVSFTVAGLTYLGLVWIAETRAAAPPAIETHPEPGSLAEDRFV